MRSSFPLFPLLAVLAGPCLVRADMIYLTNGNSVEGIVKEETQTHVVIEIGLGTMRLPKSRVARIERSTKGETERLRDEWADEHFTHRKFVPRGQEGLAKAFRDVSERRREAGRARAAVRETREKQQELREEIEEIKIRLAERSRKMRTASPDRDLAEYNSLVRQINTLNAEAAVKGRELEITARAKADPMERISGYLAALSAFEAALSERIAECRTGPPDKKRDRFLARLRGELDSLSRESSPTVVSTRRAGGTTVVRATINGRAEGEFVLDTGASLVTISQQFAARLRLSAHPPSRTQLVMADGRRIEGVMTLLGSVQIGKAKAENIPAVILPQVLGSGIDGLLGMSFLERFAVHLDAGTGELSLREFAPSEPGQ